ncbi:MAG: lamin tail domain-containing protein [Halobacteriota archaeon]
MKDEKKNIVKTVAIVTTAILVLMSMLPAMVSAQSGVKINEIMYNPSTEQGDDSDMEWIELYNNDAEAVNISDWTVDNKSISDIVMQPGDYVVLARNKTAFDAYYGALSCPVIDVTFVLANSGDTIVLCNSTGAEVDNLTYNASLGADGNGKTLERTATGDWEESLADGGTPCELNSVTIVVPYSPWLPPMIYICNITVDAMTPENVGKNATVGLFTSAEMIGNEAYYIVNISTPTDTTKMYVSTDAENEDNLMRRAVTEAPGREISNLTFDPAFVMRDFPLWIGKTWTSTSNVTGIIVNKTGAVIPINTIAVVAGKVTLEVVTVPLGTFPCVVLENNISYDIAGVPISNVRKYWMSTQNNELLSPKSQTYRNGNLVEELELIEAISPTYANESNNNTTINVTTGRFLVITLEGNPTTGYTWEVTEPLDELVLEQIGGIVDVPESNLIGAGGVQIATFEVVGAGNATIKMVYHQPWETEVEPVDTFTVNVTAS